MTQTIHRWTWPLFAGLLILLAVLLWLSPAEQTLGQAVKLVYLHGALVRTAMVIFCHQSADQPAGPAPAKGKLDHVGQGVHLGSREHLAGAHAL
jgi:hypothetical protein